MVSEQEELKVISRGDLWASALEKGKDREEP